MPYPNDRRKNPPGADDVETLSPEYLAMLVACGGEVRSEDRALLRGAGSERRYGRRKGDIDATAGREDRRR